MYQVCVKTDAQGRVTGIDSSAFLPVPIPDDWAQIDEGTGDRYHHAQGNYLDKPILDEWGVWRYKLVEGVIVERTQAEMDADDTPPVPVPTMDQRVAAMEQTQDDLVVMLADLYGGGVV